MQSTSFVSHRLNAMLEVFVVENPLLLHTKQQHSQWIISSIFILLNECL